MVLCHDSVLPMNSIINNAKLITLNEYDALSEEEKSDIEKAET